MEESILSPEPRPSTNTSSKPFLLCCRLQQRNRSQCLIYAPAIDRVVCRLARNCLQMFLWQAELLTFIHFFQVSKINILDIQKGICDIRKCVSDIQMTGTLISDI